MGVMPNFLVIGVQRSATTWLFECLKEHPEIYLPEEKELHFFDENYVKGTGWYTSFFSNVNHEKILGEMSPNYFHKTFAIDRIASDLPSVKIQIIFRNPVDRAFSAYNLYNEKFRGLSFLEAFNKDNVLSDIGLYAKHMKYIFKKIPEQNIFIGFYDDVKKSPDKFIKGTCQFLEVKSDFLPSSLNKTYNKVIFPDLQKAIDNFGLGSALEWFKETKLGESLKNSIRRSDANSSIGPKLSEAERHEVFSFYKDDIDQLEDLVRRDLSSWKN